jgi:uncharacterized protein
VRVVLDSNVLIAAFATRGLCESLVEVCLSDHELILSEHLLSEVQRNLTVKIRLPIGIIQDIISLLRDRGTLMVPDFVGEDACRDADDIPILDLAQAASADCIVTGDKDLLVVGRFGTIPIYSPRTFADSLRQEKAPNQAAQSDSQGCRVLKNRGD